MAAAPSPTNIPLPNNLAAGATTRHTTHRLWASSVSASSQAHEHNDRNATLPSPVQQQHPGKVQGRSRSLLPRLLRATGYHLATHTRTAATPHACKQNLPAAGRLSPYTRLMSHSPSAMRRMLGHPGDDDPRAGTGYRVQRRWVPPPAVARRRAPVHCGRRGRPMHVHMHLSDGADPAVVVLVRSAPAIPLPVYRQSARAQMHASCHTLSGPRPPFEALRWRSQVRKIPWRLLVQRQHAWARDATLRPI